MRDSSICWILIVFLQEGVSPALKAIVIVSKGYKSEMTHWLDLHRVW